MTVPPSDSASRSSLKRRVVILAAAVLALLLLRLIWGVIADRRVAEQLAAARPEPLTPEQLFRPEAEEDDPQNAVPLLRQAMTVQSTTADSPAMSNLEYADHPPFPAAWHKLADAAVAANTQSLQLARDARAKPHFHWKIISISPVRYAPGKSLNNARNLANLLGDGALHAHVHGDDVEALERIRDILHLGDAVAAQATLIGHLVAIGIDALAIHRLQVIAPGLKLPPRDEGDPVRRRVRLLIPQLLDDAAAALSLRRALVGERVFQIQTVREAGEKVWLLRPMYELDLARMLDADQRLLRAATQPSLPAARGLLTGVPKSSQQVFGRGAQIDRRPPRFSRVLGAEMVRVLARVIETDMRARTDRHVAAVSLAAQLYRADHAGAWPPTLEALVPEYLPAVPNDPLAADNRPLGYMLIKKALPDGRDRPIVYSVGPDGSGQTTGAAQVPNEPTYGWHRPPIPPDDQYRDLERWSAPPPTTSPAGSTAE